MFQPYVEQCGGCQEFSKKLAIGTYRQNIEKEIRSGNHASRGIFTRFNPKNDPNWDTAKVITRCSDETVVGKTIREAAAGKDSLTFLLDLLEKRPLCGSDSIRKKAGFHTRPGCFCGKRGSYHRAGYLDLSL